MRSDRRHERISIVLALCGLFVIPLMYAITGQPALADYRPVPSLVYSGAVLPVAALWLLH